MDMKQIYSQIVMQHSRNSDYKHEMEDATCSEHGHNPSCGDDITLNLKLKGDIIEKASFTGEGCAISQASTSLMCELIEGEDVASAQKGIEAFLGMIQGTKTDDEELEDALGDAVALKEISHMPQRVKCAELAWRTLDAVLKRREH
ncbi:MAG: SUF system NifU family Fe-S cluster assembly protein [Peptoniphilaceae bacterium]|nr:SUF system NifU family Fe-S cluster assembly protein [Peptoniphilaceae bacterium]MDD7434606.1 SUF system NifU family Fe-S cluster assembly protein [Peptoniphilaceae bacterium]MDD7543760.1 SUF system NifU family Fe-S cluster assembly protein [Peptoniphilaceae bacterium]MDY3075105.1 SUF system NifU family Fe-S cluster assembly protein [Peptoniphilaceae bacterium]MDY4196638.1 SUF system NifU family Fe-S cluster assembly protein [Peptoniphilaceae bacterium]